MFGNLMKQFGKAQESIKELKADLAKTILIGESGAGAVKITMNALGETLKVEIDPEIYKESAKNIVEELVAAALNDAKHKIDAVKAAKTQAAFEKMGLPPGMQMPFEMH
jgi:DNA-binding YbaB/EbfC family protein